MCIYLLFNVILQCKKNPLALPLGKIVMCL